MYAPYSRHTDETAKKPPSQPVSKTSYTKQQQQQQQSLRIGLYMAVIRNDYAIVITTNSPQLQVGNSQLSQHETMDEQRVSVRCGRLLRTAAS